MDAFTFTSSVSGQKVYNFSDETTQTTYKVLLWVRQKYMLKGPRGNECFYMGQSIQELTK